MAGEEQSAAGGTIGEDVNFGSFMRSVGREGGALSQFLPNPNPSGSSNSSIALTSALDRLSGKIDSLITTLGSSKFGGGGGGGAGGVGPAGTASSGKPNGGGSIFSSSAFKWGLGTTALAGAGFSSLWNNQMGTALSVYPSMQQAAFYSGMGGQAGLNANLAALRNPSLIRGTTGPQDTAAAAGINARYWMSSAAQQRGANAMGFSSLTAAITGTDLTGGANTYNQLTSTSLSNRLRFAGLPNFIGNGITPINPVTQSMGILSAISQRTGGGALPTNYSSFANEFRYGTKGYSSILSLAGGDQNLAQSIINMAGAQIQYSQNGGQGTLNPGSSFGDLQKAGVSSTPTQAMQKLGIDTTKQGFIFAQSEQQNIAATLAVQVDIRGILTTLSRTLAPLGRLTPIMGDVSKALELIIGARIALGGPGGTGIFGTATTGAAEGATSSGLAATGGAALAPLSAIAAGGAIRNAQRVTTGVSADSFGGLGSAAHPAPSKNKPSGHPWWQVWKDIPTGAIGDPPSNNTSDVQLVESRSSTSAQGVTGLQPVLLHDVAMMMRANPRLRLNSGFRTLAQQKALYAADPNSTMVAPPGSSMHEKGLAVDLGPASEYGWLRAHGGQYGLVNYAPEPWHWEPRGASSAGNRTDYGVSGTAPSGGNGGINAGASTSGSFTANMANAAAGNGNYGMSQGGLISSILGAPTEQGSSAYHYAGGAIIASIGGASAGGGAAGGGAPAAGSGKIGPLPTGGDKRVPGHSITQWAHDLLVAMGITPTPQDMDAMIKWANHESGGYNPSVAGGLYNPLNSTESHFGYARNGGAQGDIKDYANYQQGIKNLAWNLTHTKGAGYEAIIAALRAGNNEQSVFQAVDNSHFGTHGLGDPPAGGGGGRSASVSLNSRHSPIYANFHIYPPASGDPKKIAQGSYKELLRIHQQNQNRDS